MRPACSTPIAGRLAPALRVGLLGLLLAATATLRAVDLPATIDFDVEELPTGTIVSQVYADGGALGLVGPIGVHGTLPSNPAANSAVIFDSAMRTGGDSDLGSPHQDFGGPGVGAAGQAGQPFQNDRSLDKILIVAEDLVDGDGDGLVDDPDDGTVPGMLLVLDFSTIVQPFAPAGVTVLRITHIDAEVANPGEVRLYDAGNVLISTTPIQSTGDNGLLTQEIGPTGAGVAGVARMEISLNGSSAIDEIEFSIPSAQEEVGEQLWFLNGGDGTVTLVSLAGDPLGTIVVPGQSGPTGVAVSPDGVTWVTFHDSDAVVRFDLGGSAIGVIPVGDGPSGIAIDATGAAWVANTGDSTLWKLAPDGQVIYGGPLAPLGPIPRGALGPAIPVAAGPVGVGVDTLGNVIVACRDAGIVEKRNAIGSLVWSELMLGSSPTGVAVDRESFAWITDPGLGRIERRASDGTLALEVDGLFADEPVAIAIRGAREAWVACEGSGTLRRLVPGESPVSYPVGGEPSGISVDGGGVLWVTDRLAGTVSRWSPEGALLQTIAIGAQPGFLGDAFGLVPASVLLPNADFDLDQVSNSIEVDGFKNPYDADDTPALDPEFVEPVLALECEAIVQDVVLAWENPDPNPFAEVRVLRDGSVVATLPAAAEGFAEPQSLPVGVYDYEVVGVDPLGNESLAEECTAVVGAGDLEETTPIQVAGLAVNLFGLAAVPFPEAGAPAYYLTDPGNDVIYATDLDFAVLAVIPSPFAGFAPTTGIVYRPEGNGGLGSLVLCAGANGDPNQDATVIECTLAGTPIGDPYVLRRPISALVGEVPIKGGLAGISKTRDSSVFMAVSPENCELFSFSLDTSIPSLLPPTPILIIPAASAVHPEPGYGLNGVYFPPFQDFGEEGGQVLVSTLGAGGSFSISRLAISGGIATLVAEAVPLAAASAENVFGEFIVEGDRIAAIGITTGSVHELGGAFFVRGDPDRSGEIDIGDAIQMLGVCFLGYPAKPCVDAYDFDDDGTMKLGDTVMLLGYLFNDGPPPAVPFPLEGPDPTADGLPCL